MNGATSEIFGIHSQNQKWHRQNGTSSDEKEIYCGCLRMEIYLVLLPPHYTTSTAVAVAVVIVVATAACLVRSTSERPSATANEWLRCFILCLRGNQLFGLVSHPRVIAVCRCVRRFTQLGKNKPTKKYRFVLFSPALIQLQRRIIVLIESFFRSLW